MQKVSTEDCAAGEGFRNKVAEQNRRVCEKAQGGAGAIERAYLPGRMAIRFVPAAEMGAAAEIPGLPLLPGADLPPPIPSTNQPVRLEKGKP